MESLVGIILAAAAILALFVFGTKFFESGENVADDEACRVAIAEAHVAKKVSGGKTFGLPGISECERGDLLFKKKEIVNGDAIDQDKASSMLADAMAKCWQRYGSGKLDPFSNWGDEGVSYCSVCKVVKFDDDLKKFMEAHPDQYVQSPLTYMAGHRIRENGPTYLEYLYGNDGKTIMLDSASQEKLRGAAIPEGSYIMLQMYKAKTKSKLTAVFEVVVPVAAGIAAVALIPWTGGASIGFYVSVGGAVFLGAAAGTSILSNELGILGYPGTEAFRECDECNAYGGMQLIPSESFINMQWKGDFETNDPSAKEEKKRETLKMCDILVN